MRHFLVAVFFTLLVLFLLAVAAGANVAEQEIRLGLLSALLVGLLRVGVPWGWSLVLKRRAAARSR